MSEPVSHLVIGLGFIGGSRNVRPVASASRARAASPIRTEDTHVTGIVYEEQQGLDVYGRGPSSPTRRCCSHRSASWRHSWASTRRRGQRLTPAPTSRFVLLDICVLVRRYCSKRASARPLVVSETVDVALQASSVARHGSCTAAGSHRAKRQKPAGAGRAVPEDTGEVVGGRHARHSTLGIHDRELASPNRTGRWGSLVRFRRRIGDPSFLQAEKTSRNATATRLRPGNVYFV